jgi:hypothetical protein
MSGCLLADMKKKMMMGELKWINSHDQRFLSWPSLNIHLSLEKSYGNEGDPLLLEFLLKAHTKLQHNGGSSNCH